MSDPETQKKRGRKIAPAVFAQPAPHAETHGMPTMSSPAAFAAMAETSSIPHIDVAASAATLPPVTTPAAAIPAETIEPTPEPAFEPAAQAIPVEYAPAPVEPEPAASASSDVEAVMAETADAAIDSIDPDPVEPSTTPNIATIASAAAEPLLKGSFDMATTYETVAAPTEKAKAMFGEMNTRAKSAMEKSVKIGEEMTEFTKGNVEALVTSGRVAAKGAETMAQDVAETMKKNFESATATMKSFASVKSPTELFQLQSDYAKSYFDGAVADASKFSEAMMKLMGDIAQPLSSRYALAAEKIKATSL